MNGGSDQARRQAAEWLAPLKAHLADAGLGHISEIFDGDAPQCPAGCIAQAWSVAEVLRVLVEEVYGIRPMPQNAVERHRDSGPSLNARNRLRCVEEISPRTGTTSA